MSTSMRRSTKVLVAPCWKNFSTLRSRIIRLEFMLENLRDCRWIGLPAAGFHHLAQKEINHRGFPAAILFELLGIRGDHFVDDLAERAFIADLREAFALHDRLSRLASREHLRENLLGELAADFPLSDHADQFSKSSRCDWRLRDVLAGFFEGACQVTHNPVGRSLWIPGDSRGAFEVHASITVGCEYLGIVWSDFVLRDEPLTYFVG